MDDVIGRSKAISDKICALARIGYDRTEISNLLKIRYQLVRTVLGDAEIMRGLHRQVEAERQPVSVDAEPAAREMTSSYILLRAGFEFIGEWVQEAGSTITLDGRAPAKPGVYAFVVDGVVVYIGFTNSDLRTRFEQYRRGHVLQPNNARIKRLISSRLRKN